MDILYKNEILSLAAFQSIFNEIRQVDVDMSENIEKSLRAALVESHDLLRSAQSKEKKQLALLKEQLVIQAQSSQYLTITDEIMQKKNHLLEFNPRVYHEFMNEVETELMTFLNQKRLRMHQEIEKDDAWYSSLRDSAKKSGGSVLNGAMKGINKLAKEVKGKQVFDQGNMIDASTIVESLLETHLNNKMVTEKMGSVFERATKRYQESWVQEIAANIPNVKRLSAFSLANSAHTNLKITFQFGTTEQILAMGLGSAVMGVMGLAVGWHTLSYAIASVFPPIAVFTAVITVAAGFLTKEKMMEKRKRDIDEAVNRYLQFLLQQLYTLKLRDLGHKSISNYMEEVGQTIIKETVHQWETNYFGQLKVDHFRQLNQAFVKHLMYVNEALEGLDT